jgi:hypothetical protein
MNESEGTESASAPDTVPEEAPVAEGPSATAEWRRVTVETDDRTHSVRVLPDASSDTRRYVLPDHPSVRVGSDGPELSLVLVLERQPQADETDVSALVRFARLSLGLELGVTEPVLTRLDERDEGTTDDPPSLDHRRLYAREARFELVDPATGTTLASVTGSGGVAPGTLTATLERPAALALVDALRREHPAPALRLETTVTFRTAGDTRRVRVSGSWTAVYDALAAVLGGTSTFSEEDVRAALPTLLERDAVTVTGIEDPSTAGDAVFEAVWRQSFVVLDRVAEDRYRLGPRPYEGFRFSTSQEVRGETERTLTIRTPVEALLGGVLDGYDWERYVKLSVLGTDRPGESVLRRSRRRRRERRDSRGDPAALMLVDGGARSVWPALTEGARRAELPQATWRPVLAGGGAQYSLPDDFRVGSVAPRPRHLPVVDHGAERRSAWPDRTDPGRFWYAPSFEPVTPDPSTTDGTFEFDVTLLGKTPEGTHALRGDIRIELEPVVPEEAQPLETGHDLEPVEPRDVEVALEIPFFDRETRETVRHDVAGSATFEGDRLVATFELVDEWVELCYGALSTEGFQSLAPRIRTRYAFDAYYVLDDRTAVVSVGGKSAALPVAYAELVEPEPVYFDARSATLHLPGRSVRLGGDGASTSAGSARVPRSLPVGLATDGAGLRRANTVLATATPLTPLTNVGTLVRPTVTASTVASAEAVAEAVAEAEPEPRYGVRSVGRSGTADLLYPCETHGERYRRTVEGETETLGCDEAFAIDEIEFRLYRDRGDVLTPQLREYVEAVWQSRQRPDRYLVAPKRYRIDRYEPDHERAYGLRALLHSTVSLDASEARCVFSVRLVPDLPVFVRESLGAALRAPGQGPPVFEYPTAVATDVTYDWLLGVDTGDGSDATPSVLESDGGLFVQVQTDLLGGHRLVRWLEGFGANGTARFTMADGSTLRCALEVDPGRPTGPWSAGPVERRSTRGGLELSNPTRNPIDVSALGTAAGSTVPVEASLEPGASTLLERTDADPDAAPVYTERPASGVSLDERHLFVEDIEANVVFHCSADLDGLAVEELAIRVGLVGASEGTLSVSVDSGSPTAEVALVLPLTTYLDRPVVRYRLESTYADGRTARGDWRRQDLSTDGPIVYLESEVVP